MAELEENTVEVDEDEIVGRVAGIIQKLYNSKVNEKRIRFSRFDCINDQEVANALFSITSGFLFNNSKVSLAL